MALGHAEARETVGASPAALEAINRLSAAHGPLSRHDLHLDEIAVEI